MDATGMIAWTPKRIERLKQLWVGEKLSAGLIAKEFGCTRNAVIGKVHRLKLAGHGKPVQEKALPWKGGKPAADARYKAALKAKLLGAVPMRKGPPGGITFMDHKPGQCKWPLTDRVYEQGLDAYRCCGAPIAPGFRNANFDPYPYCLEHCRMAYHRPKRWTNMYGVAA